MKLTPQLKQQIDNYFDNIDAKELINLSIKEYRFTESDILHEVWVIDRFTYKKLQCLGRFQNNGDAGVVFSQFPRNNNGKFCIDIRYCEYVNGELTDEHCSCRRPV